MNSSNPENIPEIKVEQGGAGLRAHLAPILVLVAIFFFNFIARIVLSPLTPSIEKDLSLNHSDMGSFFFYITVGYFISLVGSGFVSSRLSHRMTVVVSAAAVGVTLLGVCLCAETAKGFGLCMFILGLVTGMYLPSGIAIITHLVRPSQWGSAIAVHELAPNLAFVAAPLLAEALMYWFSWRSVMAAIGFASLVSGALFAVFGQGGCFKGERPHFEALRRLVLHPSFFLMVGLFSMGIGSTIGVYAMLPLYLVADHGIPRLEANTLIAISRVSTLFVVFIGGWATDRFGSLRTLKSVFFFTGTATILLGVVSASWIKIVVLIQPVFAVCFFPAGFAVLSSIVPPRSRNLLISLVVPVAFMIGAGLVPTGIGILGDAGAFEAGFAAVGAFILAGSLLVGRVKTRDSHKESL